MWQAPRLSFYNNPSDHWSSFNFVFSIRSLKEDEDFPLLYLYKHEYRLLTRNKTKKHFVVYFTIMMFCKLKFSKLLYLKLDSKLYNGCMQS
jgi:hypothetical protein